MSDDDREHLVAWSLRRPADDQDYINVMLWENGEDVTVQGGRGEDLSAPDGEEFAESLVADYVAEGYTDVHRDPATGYHPVRFGDEHDDE